MKTVDPNIAMLPALLSKLPQDTPIIMLNLLRFRERALYRNGDSDCSGREAYARYAAQVQNFLIEVGASVQYMGSVHGCLIAPQEEQWDEVLLVKYPSVQAFTMMLAMPDYLAATAHRTAALDDSRLIATSAHGGG
jgi:uncharacterized protein (DUF1330 family)